jgi:hypothetical protein
MIFRNKFTDQLIKQRENSIKNALKPSHVGKDEKKSLGETSHAFAYEMGW